MEQRQESSLVGLILDEHSVLALAVATGARAADLLYYEKNRNAHNALCIRDFKVFLGPGPLEVQSVKVELSIRYYKGNPWGQNPPQRHILQPLQHARYSIIDLAIMFFIVMYH